MRRILSIVFLAIAVCGVPGPQAARASSFSARNPAPDSGRTSSGYAFLERPRFSHEDLYAADRLGKGAAGYSSPVPSPAPPPDAPLTFRRCVELALRRSPDLIASAMEIHIRRIGVDDARSEYYPSLRVRTSYVFSSDDEERGFSLAFSSDPYNPFAAGYSVRAARMAASIAQLEHVRAIERALFSLGELYLRLGVRESVLGTRRRLVELEERKSDYVEKRVKGGQAPPYQRELAASHKRVRELEAEKLETSIAIAKDNLKALLGVDPAYHVALDLKNYEEQVLAGFDPAGTDIKEAVAASPATRISILENRLRDLNIKLAWARYIPEFVFGFDATGAGDSNGEDSPSLTLGLSTTLWDWNKRGRNIERERMKLSQGRIQAGKRFDAMEREWRACLNTLRLARANEKLARSRLELASLEAERSRLAFESGEQGYIESIDARRNVLTARIDLENARVERLVALLDLRRQSGDLLRDTITYELDYEIE